MSKPVYSLEDVKQRLGDMAPAFKWKDVRLDDGKVYLRQDGYIDDIEEWYAFRDEVLRRLGPNADYKNGFYSVELAKTDVNSDFKRAGEPTPKPTRTGLKPLDDKLKEMEDEKRSLAGEIVLLDLDRVKLNEYNPNEMTDEEFNALLENMKQEGPHGTSPIEVRPIDGDDPRVQYEVIDGAHRLQVAMKLRWPKIRCIVREVDEDRAREINYAKNKLRGHINPFKEAELFEEAWRKLGTQEEVARKYGVSQPYVANALSLLKIPDEIQNIIPRGIKRSILEVLSRIDDPADMEVLAAKINKGVTVREAQEFANSLKQISDDVDPLKRGMNDTGKIPPSGDEGKKPVVDTPFICKFCGPRMREQVEMRHGGWIHCLNCGRIVDKVEGYKGGRKGGKKGKETTIPGSDVTDVTLISGVSGTGDVTTIEVSEPGKTGGETIENTPKITRNFRDDMRVSVSNAEVATYKDLLIAYQNGVLKARPFLNDDHSYFYIVKATYPDIGFIGVEGPIYIDNEEVHRKRGVWDQDVVRALQRQSAHPLRLPYTGQLGVGKRGVFVRKIIQHINNLVDTRQGEEAD